MPLTTITPRPALSGHLLIAPLTPQYAKCNYPSTQPEDEQRAAGINSNVLLAIYRVGDGVHDHRAPQNFFPKRPTLPGVQCNKRAFSAAGKQHVGSSGQNSRCPKGSLPALKRVQAIASVQLEFPFALTGLWIECPGRRVLIVVISHDRVKGKRMAASPVVAVAFFVRLRAFEE